MLNWDINYDLCVFSSYIVIFTKYYFLCRGNENVIVYACDCSTEALERVKETIYASDIVSIEHRFHTFCCDFSMSGFPTWLACNPCQANFAQTQQHCYSG